MKIARYLFAFLVCVSIGIEASTAESTEKTRKFVTISNKARKDAVIQCKSGKEISLNKTLKPEEKVRWGIKGENAWSTICQLELGVVHGHFFPFLANYCKKECKWKVFGDGLLNLNLGGGQTENFNWTIDYLTPAPAPALLTMNVDWKSPAPASPPPSENANLPEMNAETAPTPSENDISPVINDETAPPSSGNASAPKINDETAPPSSENASAPKINDETAPPSSENASAPKINDETAPPTSENASSPEI